jgi:hypothetical protein
LLDKLQAEQPGHYPDGLIRTLQRRLKIWRAERAHEMVFGSAKQDARAVETRPMIAIAEALGCSASRSWELRSAAQCFSDRPKGWLDMP